MPEQPQGETPTPAKVQVCLHTIAEILREPRPLNRDVRDVLAELVEELGRMLNASTLPPAEVAHLAESTALLARAVHLQEGPSLLADARDRVEAAVLRAETVSPLAAGLARRLLDTLSNIGI